MGLYLAVFENDVTDKELEGVEVGSYDDFDRFRTAIHERLEAGPWGSRFPTLLNHSDADGVWTSADAVELARELGEIAVDDHLAKAFVDVDGMSLVRRLIDLVKVSLGAGQSIWFQ